MNEAKGKGRAQSDEEADKGQAGDQPSMITRVAASASGLTRNLLATPNSNELNERATALGDKGQTGQSSKSDSVWAESSKASQSTHETNSPNAFRVGHNEEHVRLSENEFSSFLDGIDSFSPSQDAEESHHFRGVSTDELGEAWRRAHPAPNHPSQQPNRTVAEQESRDGEDVLALLSQKDIMEGFSEASSEDENYDWGLSAEQLQQLRAMTKDLFPPVEKHGVVDPSHPLNLNPTFDLSFDQSTAGKESWREQWDGVLNRYTDEVWGGLLPLVKDARREVGDLGSDPLSTEEPKALRRLGAILGHLRKY
ncbi:hypothetical protein D0Z07_5852 [Hyphodiscus hymeniophilus]|uniref:Uncharacterized protein n=1 Tax=Hyphodiscus hymeniophilus TaxID=353542 RepID=A0A9P6VHC9_9HELO|nr:hypothetical protein D0Z07_5852 [Hyphodiscus hymeniophilus]